ncbi:chain-length determining protein [Brevundimonas faecalis]|uniref:chain-length determining protein n=1 Tax=Brevundimonas faecalis TaxID=947378 RepID=UPI00361BBD92
MFLLVVVAPTLLTAIYYVFIASPRYVSEAQFIVRTADQQQPSSFGVALQGVGLSSAATDSFAVHRYIESRDGLRDLQRMMNMPRVLGERGDVFSRFPRPWEGRSFEDLYKGFLRFVVVGYDSTTGISTVRVEAFSGEDARDMTVGLLSGGEKLINQLNRRAEADAVEETETTLREAEARVSLAQQQLTAFRNREGVIDPGRTAAEGVSMLGDLLTTLATLRAERAQLAADAPNSPQLQALDSRIRAFASQIETERSKLAGDANSLAQKIGLYEGLVQEREFANRALMTASLAHENAQLDARRKQLYLERIVAPNLPDKPTEPKRFLAILTVLLSTLVAYGIGWLIWAGVREHSQA